MTIVIFWYFVFVKSCSFFVWYLADDPLTAAFARAQRGPIDEDDHDPFASDDEETQLRATYNASVRKKTKTTTTTDESNEVVVSSIVSRTEVHVEKSGVKKCNLFLLLYIEKFMYKKNEYKKDA